MSIVDSFETNFRHLHPNVAPEILINNNFRSSVSYLQNESTRENRNSKLLELLVLRGCDSFRKLRHVLHLTGHCILADHLHEEGNA
jgi:hypothetical protein